MYRQFYAGMELIHLPLFSLFLFLLTFLFVVVRMSRRPAKEFEAMSRMPLEEGRHE